MKNQNQSDKATARPDFIIIDDALEAYGTSDNDYHKTERAELGTIEKQFIALVAVAEAAEKCKMMMSHAGYIEARKAAIGCKDATFPDAYNAVLGQDRHALDTALANLAAVRNQ